MNFFNFKNNKYSKIIIPVLFVAIIISAFYIGKKLGRDSIRATVIYRDTYRYIPVDDFIMLELENILPDEGYPTGLSSYPKLTWKDTAIYEEKLQSHINISYPKFNGGAPVQKLNKYIFDLVNKNIEKDRASIHTTTNEDDLYENTIYLSSYYKVVGVHNGVVSIEISFTDFTGGGSGNHDTFETINWDIKSNKLLNNSELFCNNNYVEKLIPLARRSLIKQLGYPTNFWVEEGLKNEESNWDNFLVAKNGLVVLFQPYQVSNGAVGVVRAIIPFEYLPDLLCLP